MWATQESSLGFFGAEKPQRSVLTTILVALAIFAVVELWS